MNEINVQSSTGNVFEDLGFSDAEEMLLKAELAYKISDIIKKKSLSQMKAAEVLGIDQPKVSALMTGKLSGFSMERLFKFLMILGSNIQISIQPNSKNKSKGTIHIIAA